MALRIFGTRDEWLAARREYIGSSDARAVLGHGYAGESPLSVYADKIHGGEPRRDEATTTMMEAGAIGERFVLAMFALTTGLPVSHYAEPTMHVHDEYPWAAATLDGYVTHDDGATSIVEAKMVRPEAMHEWRGDDPPLKHAIQVQHQLWVTGWPKAYLAGWTGSELVIFEIARNERFIDLLGVELAAFHSRHILPRVPPEADGGVAATEALRRMYPDEVGDAVAMDERDDRIVTRLERAKSRRKRAENLVSTLENRLKQSLGSAAYGLLPSGRCLSWRTRERKEYTVPATSYRVFRVHAHTPREAALAPLIMVVPHSSRIE